MIVCNKYKVVYLGFPAKTGVTSMTNLLKTYFEGNQYGKTQHHKIIPNKCKNYTKLACSRNPYDLLVSTWSYWNQRVDPANFVIKAKNIQNIAKGKTFSEFIKTNYEKKVISSQVKILKRLEYKSGKLINFNEITTIKLENLKEELTKLPFTQNVTYEIPHINFSLHDPFYKYYDDETEKIIFEQYSEDFHTYGYLRKDGFPKKFIYKYSPNIKDTQKEE